MLFGFDLEALEALQMGARLDRFRSTCGAAEEEED